MSYRIIRLTVILFLVFSPYFLGLLLVDKDPTSVDTLTLMFHLPFYIPFIAASGIITTILVRRKEHADMLSLLGYAVPAIFVFLHELIIL